MSLLHDCIILLVVLATAIATWFYQERRAHAREKEILASNKDLLNCREQIMATYQQEQLAQQLIAQLDAATAAVKEAIAGCSKLQIVGESGKKVRPGIDALETLVHQLKTTFSQTIKTNTGLIAYADNDDSAAAKNDDIGSWFTGKAKAVGAEFNAFWQLIQELEPSLKGQKFGAFKKLTGAKREQLVTAAQIHLKANASNGAVVKR